MINTVVAIPSVQSNDGLATSVSPIGRKFLRGLGHMWHLRDTQNGTYRFGSVSEPHGPTQARTLNLAFDVSYTNGRYWTRTTATNTPETAIPSTPDVESDAPAAPHPELAAVMKAWPNLSEQVKAEVLALVRDKTFNKGE